MTTNDNPKPVVLLVEDDKASRDAMARFLERKGYVVRVAENGRTALLAMTPEVDVVLSDLKMEGMDGLELLAEIKLVYPDKPFVLITAYGDVQRAVVAMKLGAEDFLTKPVDPDDLVHKLGRLAARRVKVAGAAPGAPSATRPIIGRSEAWDAVLAKVAAVALSNCTVLVTGESGTGKELVAAAIHQNSPRGAGPFVAFSVAEIPETLVESELFGHKRGAFTGADRDHPGKFVRADGGTLFFDEIGEMTPAMQAKVLRVLETRTVVPLGDVKPRKVNLRMIFATNRDLAAEIAAGRFREDLYYRINVARIHLPPLRERRDDVPLLVRHFLAEFAAQNGRERLAISDAALDLLCGAAWPGNVRELRNTLESAVVMLRGDTITVADLPERMKRPAAGGAPLATGTTWKEAERDLVERALRDCGGNRTRAAERLQMSVRTLQRKIKEYGMEL